MGQVWRAEVEPDRLQIGARSIRIGSSGERVVPVPLVPPNSTRLPFEVDLARFPAPAAWQREKPRRVPRQVARSTSRLPTERQHCAESPHGIEVFDTAVEEGTMKENSKTCSPASKAPTSSSRDCSRCIVKILSFAHRPGAPASVVHPSNVTTRDLTLLRVRAET